MSGTWNTAPGSVQSTMTGDEEDLGDASLVSGFVCGLKLHWFLNFDIKWIIKTAGHSDCRLGDDEQLAVSLLCSLAPCAVYIILYILQLCV